MTAPHERRDHETLWETFNNKPATYVLGGLAILAVGVASKGASLGNLARSGASALLTQGANLLMDNHKQDSPRTGAAIWLGTSLAGNFALNMMRPEKTLVERVLPALAEAQIGTAASFAVKAVNTGIDSFPARIGFGALAGAIAGGSAAAATMKSESLEEAVHAMGSAAMQKAGQRVAQSGIQELGKRVGDLNHQQAPDAPAQRHTAAPIQQKELPGPAIR